MMNGLGAVAVGIEQERAVVAVAVLGSRARLAVVGEPGLGSDAPERVDLLDRRRDEADVEPPGDRVLRIGARQQEVLPLRERARSVGLVDSEGGQHCVVETLRCGPVADADRDVVEHGRTL